MILISKMRVKKLLRYHHIYYTISLLLLLLVLIFGKEVNGAKAWFDFYIISFQPSEFMKLTLAISLTKITYDFNNKTKKNDFSFLLKTTILTLLPSVLVFIEPDTGAIIFFFIIYLTSFLYSKTKLRYKLTFLFIFIVSSLSIVCIYFFNPEILTNFFGDSMYYRIDRLMNFSNNYQINNAMTLMGSTNFFGSTSVFTNLNLPEAPTDFMYAYNFYNYGLFGCFIVTISYMFLSISLFLNTKKKKNTLLKKMFINTFLFGALYNISMNIGLVPIMGIALPFFSYGGSSLIITFMFLGLYLNDY